MKIRIKEFILLVMTGITAMLGTWLIYLQIVFVPNQPTVYYLAHPPLMLYAALAYVYVIFFGVVLGVVWMMKAISFALSHFEGRHTA